MVTLQCTKCMSVWRAESKEPCPACDARMDAWRRKQWINEQQRKEAILNHQGISTDDRENLCEGCNKPLRGYSAYEVDDETGERQLTCECGYGNPISEVDRMAPREEQPYWRR